MFLRNAARQLRTCRHLSTSTANASRPPKAAAVYKVATVDKTNAAGESKPRKQRQPVSPPPTTASAPAGVPVVPATLTETTQKNEAECSDEFRANALDIQMLSANVHKQLFGLSEVDNNTTTTTSNIQLQLAELSKKYLDKAQLLGKQEAPLKDVVLPLPPLKNNSIENHFYVLGTEQSQHYKQITTFLANAPQPLPKPSVFSTQEGWTRYTADCPVGEPIPFPDEEALVFDVETLWKHSPYAIMACAMGPRAWYSWVAPELAALLDLTRGCPAALEKKAAKTMFASLIPMGLDPGRRNVIVGHNVAFDRARVLEEYQMEQNGVAWIDTMSLHSAVGGLSSQQRTSWLKYNKSKKELEEIQQVLPEDGRIGVDENSEVLHSKRQEEMRAGEKVLSYKRPWMEEGSMNSLKHVCQLYLNLDLSKDPRDILEKGTTLDIVNQFQHLMQYCSMDVDATHRVLNKVFPQFLAKCPHPASFSGMVEMGRGFLPTSRDWDAYIEAAEAATEGEQQFMQNMFLELAGEAVGMRETEAWKNDVWLKRLDWTPVSKRARILSGYPQWYRDLWDSKAKTIKITSSKRITPYLLKLTWRGYPLYYNASFGWLYRVPINETEHIKEPRIMLSREAVTIITDNNGRTEEQTNESYDEEVVSELETHAFYKIPHKDGEDANCGNPLSKAYISAFEQGLLGSAYPKTLEILKRQSKCSYWISARSRIQSQLVVTPGPQTHPGTALIPDYKGRPDGASVILPQIAVMGTVTRRAVERTWLTAANAKETRIGSELKTLIRAPPGFRFVGADVDSEELWICSLLGDAAFGIHGSTPIGFMTLQGTKAKGTDLHTVTGRIVGIGRDVAKIFNYSRFYGAGEKHSTQLLMQHSPGMDKEEANKKIKDLFKQTKGRKARKLKYTPSEFWHGGSESFVFNALEKIANSDVPKTPVLDCEIPNSLLPKHVKTDFATSRVNWTVQSSGVDYLHLLLTSMNYLMRRFKIKGRFMLSIHDEVRYMVTEDDADKAALALQISNLWTRAIFASRLGIQDLPLNIAFFSAVDIDHCLRKEVDQKCVTPTNTKPIESGRIATIYDTLASLDSAGCKLEALYGLEIESVARIAVELASVAKLKGGTELSKSRRLDLTWIEAQMQETLSDVKKHLGIEGENNRWHVANKDQHRSDASYPLERNDSTSKPVKVSPEPIFKVRNATTIQQVRKSVRGKEGGPIEQL